MPDNSKRKKTKTFDVELTGSKGTLRQLLSKIHKVANEYGYDAEYKLDAGYNNINLEIKVVEEN